VDLIGIFGRRNVFVRFQGFRRIFKYYYDRLISDVCFYILKNLKFKIFLFVINIFLVFLNYFDC
jgi:ABC-type transport system involved in cytochrome bd biosynthesis fused ATPase/permease subunit